ncbi:glycosyltransferase family 4 protein [Halochromatium roseum]|uniref:glycosyltransferase family 4 protein n=1 Tax=Halochromatium roseum TaxID=391920 RepID=UPI0019136B4C|nr:glycosyltransferase family 4 protein [Halochromatium roseum]MBK5940032.1 hypothetical protein [Halochromatium roseum]
MLTRNKDQFDDDAPRVVIVSLCYWPEKAGGAPPVQQMAEAFVAAGAQVTVLTTRPSYPEQAIFPDYRDGARDRETHQGVSIIRVPAPPQTGGRLRSILMAEGLHALGSWWHLVRRPKPTVAIAICPSILAVAAMQLAVPASTRRIAIVHDIQSGLAQSLKITRPSPLTQLLERLERIALNRADQIVTLSSAMKTTIERLGVRTPTSIIPPTVDDQRIYPLPEPPGPITLLYSGNIGRKQGLDQLIDLAEQLQHQQPQARLIIRGQGNYRETLQQHAEARSLNNLHFEPLRPAEQLNAGLAEGHIHLVPQEPAGAAFAVPSKIYAIMAAGRPFICTAAPGSPLDQLRYETDAFVTCAPNQPQALADAVYLLSADPAERKRLGRNGREYVERHAGRKAASGDYLTLIAKLKNTEAKNLNHAYKGIG